MASKEEVPLPPTNLTMYWCAECGKFQAYQAVRHRVRGKPTKWCLRGEWVPIYYNRQFGKHH